MTRKVFILPLFWHCLSRALHSSQQPRNTKPTRLTLNVGFSIPITSGLSRVRGKFTDFNVVIVYDDKDISKSSVEAVIKATSVDTGINAAMRTCGTPELLRCRKRILRSRSRAVVSRKRARILLLTAHSQCAEWLKKSHCRSRLMALLTTEAGKTTLGATAKTTINRKD